MYRVLIVEDEIPVRTKIIESVDWHNLGYEVVYAAGDGQEALDYLEEARVDLIMTDIYMPFMDGLEFIRRIRKNKCQSKVIFLTGYNEFEYAKEAVELDATRYLLKPITKAEMTLVLTEVKDELNLRRADRLNLSRLEKEYEIQRANLKERFWLDLLLGYLPEDRISETASHLSIKTDGAFYLVGVVEVLQKSRVGSAYWSQDYSILHFALKNICLEIVGQEKQVQVLLGDQGKLILIYEGLEGQGLAGARQVMTDSMNAFIQTVKNLYDMSLSAGLSNNYDRVANLHYAYSDACSAILYNVIEGANRVLIKSDLEPGTTRSHEEFDSRMNQIIAAMKLADMDRCRKELALFFERLKFEKHHIHEVKIWLISLITKAFDQYNELMTCDQDKRLLDFRLMEQIYNLEDMTLLQEAFFATLSDLTMGLTQIRDKEKNALVHNATEFIKQNYTDPSLDLTQISEAHHVSSSYFSRIFKGVYQQTFLEYLTAFRLEKAKELLRTSDLKVYEISEKVGYEDPHYFSYNFRKNVDMTPLQYRKA